MKTLATIEGCPIIAADDGSEVFWKAFGRVDVDGSGPSHGDPDYQNDTTLHLNGKPLNADVDLYIVVPPQVINGVRQIVMGCQGAVFYNGKTIQVVVGDRGPKHRLGEMSRACAIALGINPSPVSGGVDSPDVEYRIWPGNAAVVNGKAYVLQPS